MFGLYYRLCDGTKSYLEFETYEEVRAEIDNLFENCNYFEIIGPDSHLVQSVSKS